MSKTTRRAKNKHNIIARSRMNEKFRDKEKRLFQKRRKLNNEFTINLNDL